MRNARRRLRLAYELALAVGLLVVVEAGLRRTTLPATCRRLRVRLDLDGGAVPGSDAPTLPHWARPRVRAARLVTARWPAGDTCLRRCLVLGHRLRRLDPVLRIGVRRVDGVFEAHSWLEIGGRPLDVDALGFATLGRRDR